MGSTLWMKCSRYSLIVIGFVIGTEIIYRSISYLYAHLKADSAKPNDYWKVIFFPDEGILSDSSGSQSLKVLESSLENQEKDTSSLSVSLEDKVHCNASMEKNDCITSASPLVPAFSFNSGRKECCDIADDSSSLRTPLLSQDSSQPGQGSLLHSVKFKPRMLSPLHRSTSLIHMVNVLEAARSSLVVCVYLLSCSDLLEAIIRAKVRGVRVRVLIDKGMSPNSKLSSLLQNNVPVRYSRPSHMMHNKFAVVDAPDSLIQREDQDKENFVTGVHNSKIISLISNFNNSIQKSKGPSQNENGCGECRGILMTGSFNWTWSGVVSNYENVLITNNCNLICAYAKEFEKLWDLFEFMPSENL